MNEQCFYGTSAQLSTVEVTLPVRLSVCLSVYPSVCLSVPLYYNFNKKRLTIMQFSPNGTPNTQVFGEDVAEISKVNVSKTVYFRDKVAIGR